MTPPPLQNLIRRRRARGPRGFSMLEIVAATAIFAVIAAVLVPAISGVAAVRDGAAQHELAVTEAANLMERIAVLRADGLLTREQLEQLSLSAEARDQLVEPQLSISLDEAAGSPPARMLTIEISWKDQHGQRGVPVQLVTFLYDAEESDDGQP